MVEVKLNQKQRLILAYEFRAQGLANSEIARRLGISLNALKKIFQHPLLETKRFFNHP